MTFVDTISTDCISIYEDLFIFTCSTPLKQNMFLSKPFQKITEAKIILCGFLLGSLFMNSGFAQKIATFKVEPHRAATNFNLQFQADLTGVTHLPDSSLALFKKTETELIPVSFQLENGLSRKIHWTIDAKESGQWNEFELHEVKNKTETGNVLKATKSNKELTLSSNGTKLLTYHYGLKEAPEGVDQAYARSGFIHPLYTPHGQILTRIQPKDHRHHYGIWNPWTHVLYDGDTLDFWNINGKQGTVRFAGFNRVVEGPVYTEYAALHEHVVLKNNKNEVALNEVQTVRVYQSTADYYIADISSTLSCNTDNPFHILAYRYAGFGWRTTEEWDNQNSMVLTSKGKNRKEADGSTARWCIVQGKLGDDYGGAVMMSFPENYNYPEPLRIWPENQYDRGDMFANFAPTKTKDWILEPGSTYTLKYRMLVFNGKMTPEKAEEAWKNFAEPIEIEIVK